jgi:hypothetical protein
MLADVHSSLAVRHLLHTLDTQFKMQGQMETFSAKIKIRYNLQHFPKEDITCIKILILCVGMLVCVV